MAGTVGVLCTRGRVEEKLLTAALIEAGFSAHSVTPAPGPAPLGPSPSWPLAVDTASGDVAELVIDRLQDRALAEVIFSVPLFGSPKMIGAGFAARANRLDIAVRLAMVGLNRPHAFAIHDEVSGLEAAESATYPATFFPLQPKSAGLTLWDRDTAEAVLEHREMLGQRGDTLGLVQAGDGSASIRVIVVNGIAAGYEGSEALAGDPAYQLAQKAAAALDAEVIGVVLVQGAQGMEIWDIDPAPDFRNATAIGHASVASAIAARVTELANVTVARS